VLRGSEKGHIVSIKASKTDVLMQIGAIKTGKCKEINVIQVELNFGVLATQL
jgi:hypothetical protein